MADVPILVAGTASAPLSYRVPNAQELILKAVNADVDGTAASGDYVMAVELLSDAGIVIARCPTSTTIVAGASAEVSWFPAVGGGGVPAQGAGLALLYSVTLAVDTASLTTPLLPQTHTHLQFFSLARTDRAAGSDLISVQFNGDTGNNYDWEQLTGNNGVRDAFNAPLGGHVAGPITQIAFLAAAGSTALANRYGIASVTIAFYTGNTHKMITGTAGVFVDDSAAGAVASTTTGVWNSTQPITTLKMFPTLGTVFKAGTRIQIYGV
jgi:hypothetical protein